MKQTDRYRGLKKARKSEEEICEIFNTQVEMSVFSWNGTLDTIMTPLDSIRYHKYFARCGFMSMDPVSGHVKAYVGVQIRFSNTIWLMSRRQVGFTIKPFLYTLT